MADKEEHMRNVFKKFDKDETGLVEINKLFQYIRLHVITENRYLVELKDNLSNGNDEYLTSDTFVRVMIKWAHKYMNEIVFIEAERSSTMDSPVCQPNFRFNMSKREDFDNNYMNISNVSSYSTGSVASCGVDPMILQEQIDEYKFQNRKLNELLCDIRSQLIHSEECNTLLHADIERITKRLTSEQKVNELLMKKGIDEEDHKEVVDQMQRKLDELNKNLNAQKKATANLKDEMVEIELENEKLIKNNITLQNKKTEYENNIDELKIALVYKENENLELSENIVALKQQSQENEKNVVSLNDEIETLKRENKLLENKVAHLIATKHVDPGIIQQDFPSNNQNTSHIFTPPFGPRNLLNTYDSPLTYIQKQNRDSLLYKMIKNPVSPFCKDGSVLSGANSTDNPDQYVSCSDMFCTSTPCKSVRTERSISPDVIRGTHCPESNIANVLPLERPVSAPPGSKLSPSKQTFNDSSEEVYRWIVENTVQNTQASILDEMARVTSEGQKIQEQQCDHDLIFLQYENEIKTLKIDLEKQEEKLKHANSFRIENQSLRKVLTKQQNSLYTAKQKLRQYKSCARKIRNYKSENCNLQLQLTNMETDLHVLNAQLESTQSELELKDQQMTSIQINKENDKIIELEKKLADAKELYEKETSAMKSEISEMRDKVKMLEFELNELQMQNMFISSDLSAARKNRDELVRECSKLHKRLDNLASKLVTESEHTSFELKINATQNTVIELDKNVENNIEIVIEYSKDNEDTKDCNKLEVHALQNTSKVLNMDEIMNSVSYLEERIDKYKDIHENTLQQLSDLTILVESKKILEDKHSETVQALLQSDNTNKNLKAEMELLQITIHDKSEMEKNYIVEKESWAAKELVFNTEVEKLSKEISTLKAASKAISDTNSKPVIVPEKKQTRVEILHHKIERLEDLFCEEKNRTVKLTQKISYINREKAEQEQKLTELKDQTARMQERYEAKIKKISRHVEKLEYKVLINKQKSIVLQDLLNAKKQEIFGCNEKIAEMALENVCHVQDCTHEQSLRNVEQTLRDCRHLLRSHVLESVKICTPILVNILENPEILNTMEQDIPELILEKNSLLKEVFLLNCQVQITATFLKTVNAIFVYQESTEKMQPMIYSNYVNCEDQSNMSALRVLFKKKLVLKSPTLVLDKNVSASMSPDSPAMNEVSEVNAPCDCIELNNNTSGAVFDNMKNQTQVTDVDSNTHNDSEEDTLKCKETEAPKLDADERISSDECPPEQKKEVMVKQFRSMSDSAAIFCKSFSTEDILSFPSLQDNVLDTMGLHGEAPRDLLTEQDIENKFEKLALAITIDALTVADRRERQRRQRDQAESNMSTEVTKLIHGIHRLNPLCVDAEKTELVSSLLVQLDVILKASSRISTAAEVYGSVQQEWRLAESMSLMQNHIRNLKKQRDVARKQLQYTKQMFDETTRMPSSTNASVHPRSSHPNLSTTRRRASIATMSRTLEQIPKPGASASENTRRLIRRTSASGELSPRYWESRGRPDWPDRADKGNLNRPARYTQLELGADLEKIKEGISESNINDYGEEILETDPESSDILPIESSSNDNGEPDESHTLRGKAVQRIKHVGLTIERAWNEMAEKGLIHEVCCVGALICFAMCTIILGNIMIEIAYARKGYLFHKIPWAFSTWTDLWKMFLEPDGLPPAL